MTIEEWKRFKDAMLRYLDDNTVLSLQLMALNCDSVPAMQRLGRRLVALNRDIADMISLLETFLTAAAAFGTRWPDGHIGDVVIAEREGAPHEG